MSTDVSKSHKKVAPYMWFDSENEKFNVQFVKKNIPVKRMSSLVQNYRMISTSAYSSRTFSNLKTPLHLIFPGTSYEGFTLFTRKLN